MQIPPFFRPRLVVALGRALYLEGKVRFVRMAMGVNSAAQAAIETTSLALLGGAPEANACVGVRESEWRIVVTSWKIATTPSVARC